MQNHFKQNDLIKLCLNFKPHEYLDSSKGKPLAGLYSVLLHPRSAGQVRLKSSDPFDQPLIDPKMMHDENDAKIMAEGLGLILKVAKSPELAKYDFKIAEKPLAACRQFEAWSRDYLLCHGRSRLLALYHPVGTCRMGPLGENSVVDSRLR